MSIHITVMFTDTTTCFPGISTGVSTGISTGVSTGVSTGLEEKKKSKFYHYGVQSSLSKLPLKQWIVKSIDPQTDEVIRNSTKAFHVLFPKSDEIVELMGKLSYQFTR